MNEVALKGKIEQLSTEGMLTETKENSAHLAFIKGEINYYALYSLYQQAYSCEFGN